MGGGRLHCCSRGKLAAAAGPFSGEMSALGLAA